MSAFSCWTEQPIASRKMASRSRSQGRVFSGKAGWPATFSGGFSRTGFTRLPIVLDSMLSI